MRCYKWPEFFGQKCLGHGINPSANTTPILTSTVMPGLWPGASATHSGHLRLPDYVLKPERSAE